MGEPLPTVLVPGARRGSTPTRSLRFGDSVRF